jgi:tripartite-type tricarboxylate transporter receptor subunit TctC
MTPMTAGSGIVALVAAAFALATAPTLAQNAAWPQKPITMVVSNGAGSAPDIVARLLGSRMERALGQGIVIENKPGGSNVIGAVAVAKAPPDGYRLFFATSSALTANPFLTKNLPYDPLVDFKPVALTTISHNYLLVHKDVPVRTLADLVNADHKAPGTWSIGIDGPRNLAGVTGQVLNYVAKTKFVLVSYPNIVNGVQDLMAGRVQAGVFPVAITQAAVTEGVLRPIATTYAKRMRAYPDIPAVAETYPDFDFSGWFMIMAPAGTPDDIIAKLNAAVGEALKDPDVIAMGPKLGLEYPEKVGSPADATAFMKKQLEYWRKVTTDLGIMPE